jgi:hypothetical protein
MRHHAIPLMTALGLFLGASTATIAQTTGPALIAPGAGLPAGTIGGLSPQNIPIAPGTAAPTTEQIGPGGIRLAPGTVGSGLVTTPAEPRAPGLRMR